MHQHAGVAQVLLTLCLVSPPVGSRLSTVQVTDAACRCRISLRLWQKLQLALRCNVKSERRNAFVQSQGQAMCKLDQGRRVDEGRCARWRLLRSSLVQIYSNAVSNPLGAVVTWAVHGKALRDCSQNLRSPIAESYLCDNTRRSCRLASRSCDARWQIVSQPSKKFSR